MCEQQWDSELVEGRYIKDLEDNLSIIRLRFGDNSKPLFRKREFIVYERRETMEDGTLVYTYMSFILLLQILIDEHAKLRVVHALIGN